MSQPPIETSNPQQNERGVKGDEEVQSLDQENVMMVSGCIRRTAECVGRQSPLDILWKTLGVT
jgi:hypothetical protein